jgi:hypothetical protein
MQKWEHMILTVVDPTAEDGGYVSQRNGKELPNWRERKWRLPQALQELGDEGWELVSVMWRNWGREANYLASTLAFLKRPKS